MVLTSLAYLFFAYLSVWMSYVPWRTFKHVTEEVSLNLLVFWTALFWSHFSPREKIKRLGRYLFLSFLWVVFLYFFFYALWLWKGPIIASKYFSPSLYTGPLSLLFNLADWNDWLLNRQNISTYFLFPSSLALAYTLLGPDPQKRKRALVIFLFFLGLIFLTSKRSALLGLLIGGVLGTMLARRSRYLLFLLFLFLGLFLVIWLSPLKSFFVRENFKVLFHGGPQEWKEGGSIPWRIYGLPFYLDYIKKHPWRGIGFGRLNIKSNPETKALAKKARLAHAHNVFLNMALYLGLPGALAFVLFTLNLGICLFFGFKRGSPYAWLVLGFLIYFISFWVRYQFDDSFRYATSAFYYLNLGLGLGIASKNENLLSSR